jgi:hypothetical protein
LVRDIRATIANAADPVASGLSGDLVEILEDDTRRQALIDALRQLETGGEASADTLPEGPQLSSRGNWPR